MTTFLSGKIKKRASTQVDANRYSYFSLSDIEPDLGVPFANSYILSSDISGNRSWIDPSNLGRTGISVTQNAASGNGTLTYNDVNGVFTYTPPDLSAYLTAETNDLTSAVVWADVPDTYISSTAVTQHQAALSITESQISDLQAYLTAETDPVYLAEKGQPLGAATLDANGLVPSSQLPSYVDDVLSYANFAAFPIPGETGKIYVDQATGDIFRWDGVGSYIQINDAVTSSDQATQLATARDFSLTGDVTATAVSFNGTGNVALSTSVTQAAVTQHQAALSITESQISDLQGYLTAETNDLTSAVVWADVPDTYISSTAVTQHQAALSITESQISDLQNYLTAETNDLTSAVVWANVPDANITQSSVTQHQAALSITESQISDLGSYLTSETDTLDSVIGRGNTTTTTAVIPFYYADQNAFPSATTYHGAIAHSHTDGAMYFAHAGSWAQLANNSDIPTALTDLGITDGSNNQVLTTDGAGNFSFTTVSAGGIALTNLSVTQNAASGDGTLTYNNTNGVFTYTPPDLSGYLTAETNDLTSAVVWADVPDTYISSTAVTQHQAALSITESQISDLQSYLTAETDPVFSAHTTSSIINGTGLLKNDGVGNWSYDNSTYLTSYTETNDLTSAVVWADVPDANITQSSITQHQAALNITESQISDLQSYLTAETNDLTSAVVWADVPDIYISSSAVTQHQAALSITESQISDFGTYLTSETNTTLTGDSVNQRLVYTDENGTVNNIDLSWAVDDTNLARITSGTVDANTGIATFTRDDTTDFTVDFSALFDDTNLTRITSGSVSGNTLTLTRSDATTVSVDVSSLVNIELTDLSVTQNAASGNGTLLYDNTTGVFTYTPPDLSGYLTTETNDLTSAVVWADVPDTYISSTAVTQHQAALSITESQISDLQNYFTEVEGDNRYLKLDDGNVGRGSNKVTSVTSNTDITFAMTSFDAIELLVKSSSANGIGIVKILSVWNGSNWDNTTYGQIGTVDFTITGLSNSMIFNVSPSVSTDYTFEYTKL